jgi:hypothetical protein
MWYGLGVSQRNFRREHEMNNAGVTHLHHEVVR